MRASAEGIVEHDHVAWFQNAGFHGSGDGHGHGAEMDGHMVAHGDDLSRGIKDGARVIAALFDVGRKGSAPQRGAHFFGNRVVEVLKDLEFYGVGHVGDECTSSDEPRWFYATIQQ